MGEIITLLITAAKTAGISPALLIAVCMTETNLRNVHLDDDGGSASYGICQVKLKTAHFMGKVYKRQKMKMFTENDMKEIEKNARVAAFYLKYQINRYDGDLCKAVAAYNAGRYKESTKYPGVPFNWKYVEKVRNNIEDDKIEKYLGSWDTSRYVNSGLGCKPDSYEVASN